MNFVKKIVHSVKTVIGFFQSTYVLIPETYFKFNKYVEEKTKTSVLRAFGGAIILGLAAALISFSVSYFTINDQPHLKILLLYGTGILLSWLAMTFVQTWRRKYYLEFVINTGISIAYHPFILLSPSHEAQLIAPIIIWIVAFACLLITNSFYMMLKGKLEWD